MGYISDRIVGGYRRVATAYNSLNQIVDAGMILPSGLYFAAAGAPGYSFNHYGSPTAPDSSVFKRNVIEWPTIGNRVIVRGDGVKNTVSLYPTNGQHYSERDVLTNLRAKGLNPTSAIAKKIARELKRLRRLRHT